MKSYLSPSELREICVIYRLNRNYSIRAMAKKLGIDFSSYFRFERGQRTVTKKTFIKMCESLELHIPDEILIRDDISMIINAPPTGLLNSREAMKREISLSDLPGIARAYREKKGFSATQMAAACGLYLPFYKRVEANRGKALRKHFIAVATFLGYRLLDKHEENILLMEKISEPKEVVFIPPPQEPRKRRTEAEMWEPKIPDVKIETPEKKVYGGPQKELSYIVCPRCIHRFQPK